MGLIDGVSRKVARHPSSLVGKFLEAPLDLKECQHRPQLVASSAK
jgi:hypothetical protein